MYFTPKHSLTRENCRRRVPCALKIYDFPEAWEPRRFTIDLSGYQWGEKDHRKATKARYSETGFDLTGERQGYYSCTSRDFRLAFSDDGKTISIGSSTLGRNILRWNTSDGSFAGSFDAHEDDITISPDARLALSWSAAGLGLWEVEKNSLRSRFEHRHSSPRIVVARFAPDCSRVAVVFKKAAIFRSSRYHLQVWDTTTGSALHETQLAEGSRVRDQAFACSDALLAVILDKTLVLLDVRTGEKRETQGGVDWLEPNAMALSDDGSLIVVVTRDSVAFYEVDPFAVVAKWTVTEDKRPFLDGYLDEIQAFSPRPNLGMEIAVSANRKTAAVSLRTSILLFDLTASAPQAVLLLARTHHRTGENVRFFHSKLPIIDALAFSPCGTYLACAGNDDLVSIWDVSAALRQPDTVNAIPTPDLGTHWSLVPVSSPDGKLCGTWSTAKKVVLCEVATASAKIELDGMPNLGFQDKGSQLPSNRAWAFSPDSSRAVTVISLILYLVNTRDWTQVEIPVAGRATALAFNSQSTLLALSTRSTDGTRILLLDAVSGSPVFSHAVSCDAVRAIAFSTSGTLVTAGETPENFVYHVWHGPDHNRQGAFEPSQCFNAERLHPASEKEKAPFLVDHITGMTFSTDDTVVVAIVTFFFSLYGPRCWASVETITLTDPPQFGQRKQVTPNKAQYNYFKVQAHGNDKYDASYGLTNSWLDGGLHITSLAPEGGRETMTAGGVQFVSPDKETRKRVTDIAYRFVDGSGWVFWKGHRVLRLPTQVLWIRQDSQEVQDVMGIEPGQISFLTVETPAGAEAVTGAP
ncbi:hypothetical protein VTG60DRAFT_3607 [Thermothelomyces hinnuleus]